MNLRTVTAGLVTAGFALFFVLFVVRDAQAQNYCAKFYDDTQTCGIPSLQECERTVSGVGGDCMIDDSAEIPRGRSMLRPIERLLEQGPDGRPHSPALDDVPPPPGN